MFLLCLLVQEHELGGQQRVNHWLSVTFIAELPEWHLIRCVTAFTQVPSQRTIATKDTFG